MVEPKESYQFYECGWKCAAQMAKCVCNPDNCNEKCPHFPKNDHEVVNANVMYNLVCDAKKGNETLLKTIEDLKDILRPILAVVISGGIVRVGNRTSIWECMDAIRKAQKMAIEKGFAENHTCDNCATPNCEVRGELGCCNQYTKKETEGKKND